MRTDNEIHFSVSYNNLPDKIKRITLQTFSDGGEEILVTVCADIAEPSVTENYCPDEPAVFNGTITPDNLTNHAEGDAYFTFERLSDAIEKQLVVLKLETKIN